MRMCALAMVVTAVMSGSCRDEPRLDLAAGYTMKLSFGGGSTPFYDSTTIHSDGRVERALGDWGTSSAASGTAEPGEIEALRRSLETDGFANLAPQYGEHMPDAATLDLSVGTPSQDVRISCEGPCGLDRLPAALASAVQAGVAIRNRATPERR
jgi:hypothetical protein